MTTSTLPDGASADVKPGELGRFQVVGVLGAGGMGIVLAAHDPDLDRPVALKILHPSIGDATQLAREATVMARLAHPNVVTVYEVGRFDDRLFLAMELVDGTTLRGWLRERSRTWREVVAMFLDIGHGLVAAHDHGLVHRDFKPDNVLIGRDGRPRVTDFGVAGVAQEAARDPDDAAPLTTCTAVGTPAYMSPEQWMGGAVNARTDQFAFCVALWEALHGERPFAGERAHDVREAACEGRLRAPVRRVPRWLDRALRRGLEVSPAVRWPDLASLLDRLATGLRRRRWWVIAGSVGVGAGVAAAIALATREAVPQPCSGVAAPFAAMWSAGERARIERGFVAGGGPIATPTWALIAPAIDQWGTRWVAMRREACEASAAREQSAQLLDLRMTCLDDRRRELAGLLAGFGAANPATVAAAVNAVAQLEPIARCADVTALASIAPVPARLAPVIGGLKTEVAEITAANRLNRDDRNSERAEHALAAARSAGYAPLEAEAMLALGDAQRVAGKYEQALTTLEGAALAADRARDDRLRVVAWSQAARIASWQLRRGADALRISELARAALARVRDPGNTLAIHLGNSVASAYRVLGNHADGLREIDAALALVESTTDPSIVVYALSTKATLLFEASRYDDAIPVFQRALALQRATLGPGHPNDAKLLTNLAGALMEGSAPDYRQAEALQREAIAISERLLGPDNLQLSEYLVNLVSLLLRLDRGDEALPLARRAFAIRERADPNTPNATAIFKLAIALHATGSPDEAEPLFGRSIDHELHSPPQGDTYLGFLRRWHAVNLMALHRPADAVRELDAARAIYDSAAGTPADAPAEAAEAVAWQAAALVEAGNAKRGLACADDAIARTRAIKQIDRDQRSAEGLARWHRGRALLALGRRSEALAEVRAAIATLAEHPDVDANLLRGKLERWVAAQAGN